MFRRDRDSKEMNGGPPVGQVRVLVVGDSGVGKTSLVHLITKGSSISHPTQTIGCTVSVKHITSHGSGPSSNSDVNFDTNRGFFIELWDVSGHDRYKDCRSLFYSQINGVVFVYDLSQRRTKASLHKWAAEIAATGTFLAPLATIPGPGGLPVPYIVVGNKADIASSERTRGSSGNLVDVARQWVEKQGLLPHAEDLPLVDTFSNGGLVAAAKEARYDKESLMKFFRLVKTLIKRRYFSDELPWSSHVPRPPSSTSSEIVIEGERPYESTSFPSDPSKFNALPPLPAQHNLKPPPTLYPQEPMTTPDHYRFAFPSPSDSGIKSKRADINV
ncbi:hypothetical protein M569_03525 [Genlisea aurea]|uniref:Uncharacterized protein n=1 Tax=Genlisea aurea TaxID=192259 RepID=S8E605_9LAMI|nr:hypothetical protein M569_03525 [Genlisea aurea]